MGDKNKIDELFSQGLDSFEATPNQDIWSRVNTSLDEKKRKRKLFIWRWTSTAAAILLAFFAGYYYNNLTQESEQKITHSPVIQHNESITNQKDPADADNANLTPANRESTIADLPQEKQENITAPAAGSTPINQVTRQQLAETSISPKQLDLFGIASISESDKQLRKPSEEVIPVFASTANESTASLSGNDIQYYEDSENTNKSYRGFNVTAMASPTFPFSDVNLNENNEATSLNIQQEELNNSYAAGMNVGYRTSKRWELQTGVIVNNWSQQASDILLSVSQPTSVTTSSKVTMNGNTSLGNVDFTGTNDPTSQGLNENSSYLDGSDSYAVLPGLTESYQFIDIPLSVGYYLIDSRKWSIKINGGLNSRFLNSSNVQLIYANGEEESYEDLTLNKYSMQLMAGAGLGYHISKNLQFGLQPSLLYGITRVNKHNEVDTYFHQMLIYSALTYSF